MTKTFMPAFESREALEAHQLKGLQWTVAHAYAGSAFYRQRLDAAGVRPDEIRTLHDLKRMPFTTADDLRAGYPFPLLAVPPERVVRVHASSGTTGKKKVLAYTRKDIDDWAHFFARCYEMAGLSVRDRVQIAVGYGLWTAGAGFQLGCERFGAMAVPIGPGNMEMQCQFLEDLESTVMCCTASMGLLMAEEVARRGLREKIHLKKMIFGSERSSEAMRQRIRDLLGLEDMFDITGLTELYGPGTGLDCPQHEGIHYWADYYLLEVLDPASLEPVAAGQIGEMVVTTLCKEAAPLIRYRTRDLTRLIERPCACGSILPLHDRILGRSDDMIIFRGVNMYPGQIDQALSTVSDAGCEFQVVLERAADGKDVMTIRLECCEGSDPARRPELAQRVAQRIKQQLMVSPQVEIVDYCSLPRSERKAKRIFDKRPV
jgi:phenylacetate-CoA ligase